MKLRNWAFVHLFMTVSLEFCLGDGYLNPYVSPGAPVVTTNNGCVRGEVIRMPNTDVSIFLGIPYAKPPVSINRFKKPFPVKSWSGVLDATIKSPSCMQFSSREYSWVDQENASEDCLYLNIWVPCSLPSAHTSRFPVMVWIHGGAFQYGSGKQDIYDGSILADTANVIVVSMNYRLGVFGFLDAGIDDAPGNMGLLDQTLALKWIKENIEYFGGNSDMITLFGQSAGAVSVGMHMISPLSRGLFHRAIMESGSPYHPFLQLPSHIVKLKGSVLAAQVGCSNDTWNLITDPKGVISCMKDIDAEKLAIVDGAMLETSPFYFIPTYGNEFMPKPPIEYIESGDIKDTELLIGFVKDEGSIFVNYLMPQVFDSQYLPPLTSTEGHTLISALFQNSTIPPPDAVANFYLRNVDPHDSYAISKSVYDSFGDSLFACPVLLFAKKAKNEVYFYHFTHRPTNTKLGDWMGTAHFDEVPFVFGIPLKIPFYYTAEEGRFSQNIIQKWTNFARNGSPASMKSNEYWPKFTSSNPRYLELNPRNRKVGSGIKEEECEFWLKNFHLLATGSNKSVKM